jgi:glycosyltransferase involved in cell wall biosynthesis
MAARQPTATVLIGAYDNASTVGLAIESILRQTVEDIELVVIDDGSSDSTAEEAERAIGGDPRGSVLRLERNRGIADSLNVGLGRARASLVAIQDADDFSVPERLARQLEKLSSDGSIAVVGARMLEVDPAGRELRPRTSFAPGDVGRALMRFNPIPNGCAAFRVDAALAMGGYDPRYRFAPEYDLWMRLAERHRVVALDEVLAPRVMGPDSVGARAERAQIGEAIVIRLRTMRRRRSPRGVAGLIRPLASYATPIPAKRALRTMRGQAP